MHSLTETGEFFRPTLCYSFFTRAKALSICKIILLLMFALCILFLMQESLSSSQAVTYKVLHGDHNLFFSFSRDFFSHEKLEKAFEFSLARATNYTKDDRSDLQQSTYPSKPAQVDNFSGKKDHLKESQNERSGTEPSVTSQPTIETQIKCPTVPSNLEGNIKLRLHNVPSVSQQEEMHPELERGGHYKPSRCQSRHKVAIIVPYRNREENLKVFLTNMHPLLQKQLLDYTIFVIEQSSEKKFNRAMLMNVGAVEALKVHSFDCFVFHDVDLLPEDDRNLYYCPEQPRHMAAAVDKFGYKLPYKYYFGGVTALTVEQFKKVNGFSNCFWGWGGEDDDIYNRVHYHNYSVVRYPKNIARYRMLSHKRAVPSQIRFKVLERGKNSFSSVGLNSLEYEVLKVELKNLFTHVLVKLKETC